MGFFPVKVCVLGASGVGKTCITMRYVQDTYDEETSSTIGASFLQRNVTTENDTHFKLQIWDTAGQERFRSIAPLYYRGASVMLIVFDLTDRSSLTKGAREWMKQVNENTKTSDLLLALVGNKLDAYNFREVKEAEARDYAKSIGAMYWETSAKTGANIEELFVAVCSKLEEQNDKHSAHVTGRKPQQTERVGMKKPENQHDKSQRKCCV